MGRGCGKLSAWKKINFDSALVGGLGTERELDFGRMCGLIREL